MSMRVLRRCLVAPDDKDGKIDARESQPVTAYAPNARGAQQYIATAKELMQNG